MNREPVVIVGPLPGQAVDEHLKRFGHLPVTDLCDEDGTCVRRLPELWRIVEAARRAYDFGGIGFPDYLLDLIDDYEQQEHEKYEDTDGIE